MIFFILGPFSRPHYAILSDLALLFLFSKNLYPILIYFIYMEILIPDRSKSRFVSTKKLENTRKIPLSKKDGCKVREASIE